MTEYTLPEYVAVSDADESALTLVTPRDTHRLRGKSGESLQHAVECLRTGASLERLCDELGVDAADGRTVLNAFRELGLLRRADGRDDADPSPRIASRERFTSDGTFATRSLAVHTTVEGMNLPLPPAFERTDCPTLSAVEDALGANDLLLTVTTGVSPDYHRELLDLRATSGTTWLPVRFVGDEIQLGPVHRDAAGGCYECFYQRSVCSARSPRDARERHRIVEDDDLSLSYSRAALDLGGSIAALHLRELAGASEPTTPDGSVSFVALDGTGWDTSDVVPVSGCERCARS